MHRCLSALLVACAHQTFLRQLVAADGRFESLEECEKAYDELLGKTAEPAAAKAEETATATTTEAPEETPEEKAKKPVKKKEVAVGEKKDAKPTYKPPMSGTGKPSDSEGWDYAKKGKDWADTPGGAGCAGAGQSPIDITKFVDIGGQTKSVLWFDYYADPSISSGTAASLANTGHGPFFTNPDLDLGYVKIGNEESEAIEYVFHAPSEHTIDGQTFPLELQILHKRPGGELLGIAVLFKNGNSNEFLAALKEAAPDMPTWHVETGATTAKVSTKNTEAFNLEAVLQTGPIHPGGDLTFYNYEGSLTAPPCTGGVQWYVSADPMEASKDEIAHVTEAIYGSESTEHGNARATQPHGGRKILVGHTGFQHHIKQHGHKDAEPPMPRGYTSQDTPWHKEEEKKEE